MSRRSTAPKDPYTQLELIGKNFFLADDIRIDIERLADMTAQYLNEVWEDWKERGEDDDALERRIQADPQIVTELTTDFGLRFGKLFVKIWSGQDGWGWDFDNQIRPLVVSALRLTFSKPIRVRKY